MSVSIVISSHGRPETLKRSLEHLDLQGLTRYQGEIMLVGCADDPATAAVMRAFAARAAAPVKMVSVEQPGAMVAGRQAVAAANGEIVIFAADDCLMQPGYVDAVMTAMRDGDVAYGSGSVVSDSNGEAAVPLAERAIVRPGTLIRAGFFDGRNFFFRREVFLRLGGFREEIGAGAGRMDEVYELTTRANLAGHSGLLLPSAQVVRIAGSVPDEAECADLAVGATYAYFLAQGIRETWFLWKVAAALPDAQRRMQTWQLARLQREFEGAQHAMQQVFESRVAAPREAMAGIRAVAVGEGVPRVIPVDPKGGVTDLEALAAQAEGAGDSETASRRWAEVLASVETAARWSRWANAEILCGRYPTAEKGLRRALAMEPSHQDASLVLGMLLAQQGRYAEALPLLEPWEEQFPEEGGEALRNALAASRSAAFEQSPCSSAQKRELAPAAQSDAASPRGPQITFGIITHGKRPWKTLTTIISILQQEIPPADFEIVIGGNPEALGLEGTIASRVRFVPNPEAAARGQLGRMRNDLSAAARFPWILYCDDDLFLTDGWYQKLTVFLRARPGSELISFGIRNVDGSRHWDWALADPTHGNQLMGWDQTDPRLYITGGCSLVRVDLWRDHPWDGERGFGQQEDSDWSQRIIRSGAKVAHCADAYVLHNDWRYFQWGVGVAICSNIEDAMQYLGDDELRKGLRQARHVLQAVASRCNPHRPKEQSGLQWARQCAEETASALTFFKHLVAILEVPAEPPPEPVLVHAGDGRWGA